MHPPEEQAREVRAAVGGVVDPCSAGIGVPIGIDDMGLIDEVTVDAGGTAVVRLQVTSPSCMMAPYFVREVERRAREVEGVRAVSVEIGTDLSWTPARMSGDARRRMAARADREAARAARRRMAAGSGQPGAAARPEAGAHG